MCKVCTVLGSYFGLLISVMSHIYVDGLEFGIFRVKSGLIGHIEGITRVFRLWYFIYIYHNICMS